VHGETGADGKPTATNRLMNACLAEFGAANDEAEVFRAASPITYVTKNAPPTLLLHGRADTTVSFTQSEQLARVLTERGVEHEFVPIDGIGHTFDWQTWNRKPLAHDLRPVALAFLEKHLALAK
jgi:dipeptidyl aminopeptidase/acylaminoacyl peptidase